MFTSSKLAQKSTPQPRPKRPSGHGKRFKDGFSPDFRLLQITLHTYVNLQRLHARSVRTDASRKCRRRELRRLWTIWWSTYQKYYPDIPTITHPDSHLYPLELRDITLHSSLLIDIPFKITSLKKRMHGRRRMILRSLLSDRTHAMQTNFAVNKLRKVIQMVLPKPRSSLNFADLKDKDGNHMTDQIRVNLAASSTMKEWMGVPPTLHPPPHIQIL